MPMARILAGFTAMSRCGPHDDGDLVERVGDHVRVGLRTEVHPVEQAEHDDGDGELVAGLGGQQGRVAAGRVLGDERLLGSGDDDLAAASYGLGDRGGRAGVPPSGASTTTRSRLPAHPGRPGPGQATKGTGQTGSSTARSSRESGPAATTARGWPSESRCTASATASCAATASRRTRAPPSAR